MRKPDISSLMTSGAVTYVAPDRRHRRERTIRLMKGLLWVAVYVAIIAALLVV